MSFLSGFLNTVGRRRNLNVVRIAVLALSLALLLAGSGPTKAATPEVDRLLSAIRSAQVYVTRLSAVRRPSRLQVSKLALYRSRLRLYRSRLAALSASPSPVPIGVLTSTNATHDQLGLVFGDQRHFWRYSVEQAGNGLAMSIWDPVTTDPEPVFVLVHGGPLATPAHDNLGLLGGWLADYGGALAIGCDWRSLPGGWPSPSGTDITACIKWAKDNAARYGADPTRLVLVAHSLGGYPSASIALGALGDFGVQAYASVAAITSTAQVSPGLLPGAPDPVALIAGGHRLKVLVAAGSLDPVANITASSRAFADALGSAGYQTQYLLVSGADHTTILGSRPVVDALIGLASR